MNTKSEYLSEFFCEWDPSGGPMPYLWCNMAAVLIGRNQFHVSHPVFTFEMILEGSVMLEYRGYSHFLEAGDIVLLEVGESHRFSVINDRSYRKFFAAALGEGVAGTVRGIFGNNCVLHPDRHIRELVIMRIKELKEELKKQKSISGVSAALYRLFVEAGSCCCSSKSPELEEALRQMKQHLADPLSVPEIAKNVKVSERRLNEMFIKYFQMTPARYYLLMRLKKGAEFLLDTNLSIKEIAMMTGYNSGLAFARAFRKNYGIRPSVFRKQSPSVEN